ncbi:MAG: response regulator [Geobacteraceae bacterium]|nr:response regulator [Geobacteraceae bacterium]
MNLNLIKWNSLKTRITLVMLSVFVISIWSLSLYANRLLQKELKRQLGEQQFSVATLLSAEINQELDYRLKSLEKLTNKITPALLSNTEKLQTLLEDRPLLQELFNGGYYVVTPDGTATASIPLATNRRGINYMDRDSVVAALKDGKSTVGKPFVCKRLKAPVLVMGTPVRDAQGRIIGALIGVINLSKSNFMEKIFDSRYGKTGGYLLAAPQHKLIVAATDKKRNMQPMPAPGVNPLFDRYKQGFEGFDRTINALGVDVLSASKQIPIAGWFLVVSIPVAEAFTPIYATQQQIMVATIFLTLLTGCIIWWVLKIQIAPIFDTIETLSAMSASNQPAKLLPIVKQDEIGQLIGSFNSMLNTIRHREEALKFSEERFRKAIEEAPFPIMIHAEYGEVLALSRTWTELSGYSLADIPTTAIWAEKAFGLNQRAALIEMETLYDIEHRKNEGEFTVNCRDGSKKIWDFSSVPINFISDGRRTAMSMAADVTDRKRAEEEKQALEQQLHQAQKLDSLGVLAGGIAHDFNNILAVITGYCYLIKMDYETAEKSIPQIEKAAERAAGLCRQMLAYAGKAQAELNQVNMWMLVDEMVKMLESTINQNVVIKSDLSTNIPFFIGDESQLRQIVMNLIINASEAIGEAQGEIRVSLRQKDVRSGEVYKDHLGKAIKPGNYACLEVSDSGCGMDDETKQRIFEPFFTTKFAGRGLGMSAVLGILSAHKGALQLTSQPEQGTIFKVYLPIEDSNTAEDETLNPAPSAPWQGGGTILLVEDEKHVILIAKTMLRTLGFKIIEAANGKEALEFYQNNAAEITLVVTDIGMPVMDGYELFRELKKLNYELPIIISSGFGKADITSRIPLKEIAGLISKPYNFDQLRDVLKVVVDNKPIIHQAI